MSLSVNIRIYDESGDESQIELKNGKDLAGVERLRFVLYGSELAEKLGFKILPQLKNQDLYVKSENLNELENELKTILENIDEFSKTAESEQEYIKARVQNILDAVQIAKKANGVIVIR